MKPVFCFVAVIVLISSSGMAQLPEHPKAGRSLRYVREVSEGGSRSGRNETTSPEKDVRVRLAYDLLWESYDSNSDKWFAWIQFANNQTQMKLFESDGPPREWAPRSLQHPIWSSDGRKLAYYLDIGDDYMMYEYDMSRKTSRGLTTGYSPSYSPAGDRLVYCAVSQRTDEAELWIYGTTDGSDMMVTELAQGCLWPSWSPEGKWVLFNSFDDAWNIYLLDTEAGVASPLTKGNRAIEKPIWSPDGKRIAYWILRTDEIVIANLKGNEISTIGGDSAGIPKLGNFSPNGSKVVYTRLFEDRLFVHDCSTNKTTTVCRMEGYISTPSYSPDGKWIAFQFNKSSARKMRGRWDVYVVRASGGKPLCLTEDFPGHSIAPCWRPTVD